MASLRCPVWHFNYIVVDRTETKAAMKKLEPAVSEEMGNGMGNGEMVNSLLSSIIFNQAQNVVY